MAGFKKEILKQLDQFIMATEESNTNEKDFLYIFSVFSLIIEKAEDICIVN